MAANADYRAALEGHNTAFKVAVAGFMAQPVQGEFMRYTEKIDGGGAQLLQMAAMGNTPLLARWNGARVYKEPRAYTNTIRPYPYVATMPLPRVMVNQDNSGVIGSTINQYAKATVDFFDQVVAADNLSNSGAGPTGPDGVALYATNHPHADSAGSTQGNLGSGTNLSHSTLIAGETAMGLLTEENGRNFGVQPNELHGGIRLRRRMQELVGPDRVVTINLAGTADVGTVGPDTVNAASTRTNVLNGDYTVIVDRRYTTSYYWTLRDNRMPKAMVLFVTRAPEVINQIEMTDEQRYQNDMFTFGIEADVGTGAWFWPSEYRGTGTG